MSYFGQTLLLTSIYKRERKWCSLALHRSLGDGNIGWKDTCDRWNFLDHQNIVRNGL